MEHRRIGSSELSVSAVGLGTWQWGSRRYWRYGVDYGKEDIAATIKKAQEVGIDFIDTAEVYGSGMSEKLIGELVPKDKFTIATKFLPLHLAPSHILGHAERSLERLQVRTIDLYQIHWHNPALSTRGLMKYMEQLVREGKIRYIGVSNFGVGLLEEARSFLSRNDIVSNQVRYNLLHRAPEENGMLDYCRKEKISIIAWSPLEQGILTGKWTSKSEIRGGRRINRYYRGSGFEAAQPLVETLREVSAAHGKTPAQGALAWLIRNPEVIVIPGARSPKQAEDNAGAAGWSFTSTELKRLDDAYASYQGKS
jgi:aryl-alcohol dehydrogenase-like predicted oxidoreductase